MAAINFTVNYSGEDSKVTIEVEWIDEYTPAKLDDNLMPIINEETQKFERYEDDLNYKTIKVTSSFLDNVSSHFVRFDAQLDELYIGEWTLYVSDYDVKIDAFLFTQKEDEFKRNIEYEIPLEIWSKGLNMIQE